MPNGLPASLRHSSTRLAMSVLHHQLRSPVSVAEDVGPRFLRSQASSPTCRDSQGQVSHPVSLLWETLYVQKVRYGLRYQRPILGHRPSPVLQTPACRHCLPFRLRGLVDLDASATSSCPHVLRPSTAVVMSQAYASYEQLFLFGRDKVPDAAAISLTLFTGTCSPDSRGKPRLTSTL